MKQKTKKMLALIMAFAIICSMPIFTGAVDGTSDKKTEKITMTEYDPATGVETEKVYEIDPAIIKAVKSADLANESMGSPQFNTLSSLEDEFTATGLVKVFNTEVKPYSPIGLLKIKRLGVVKYYATAFLISDNVAITSAHCLYNKKTNKWNDGGYFYPGKNGSTVANEPYGSSTLVRQAVCTQYIENDGSENNSLYDWGAVVLSKPLGKKAGTLSISTMSDLQFSSSSFMTVGYPQSETSALFNYNQYQRDIPLHVIGAKFVSSSVHSFSGQSGSPLLVGNVAVGILSSEFENREETLFTRITDSAYSYLMEYVAENA